MDKIKELRVEGGSLLADGQKIPCTIGKSGMATDKREGDMKTPSGSFPLRCCYYRPDRVSLPETALPLTALAPDDGWCDDVAHPMYNKPVKLPFTGRHEKLWREDNCYDLIIPLGYNDDSIIAGKGSAIFLHVMHDDGRGTEGCVAVGKDDLLKLLTRVDTETVLTVS